MLVIFHFFRVASDFCICEDQDLATDIALSVCTGPRVFKCRKTQGRTKNMPLSDPRQTGNAVAVADPPIRAQRRKIFFSSILLFSVL